VRRPDCYVADVGQTALAQTRLVSLAGLLAQRAWPAHEQLVARLIAYGRAHGAWDDADVEAAATRVELAPGGLLIFDNLAVAHGRRGVRQPGELHQRVIGRRGLSPTAQVTIRDRVLRAFSQAPGAGRKSLALSDGDR
jgi:hypothetical protein